MNIFNVKMMKIYPSEKLKIVQIFFIVNICSYAYKNYKHMKTIIMGKDIKNDWIRLCLYNYDEISIILSYFYSFHIFTRHPRESR